MKFHITGASIQTEMKQYRPVLEKFAVTDPVDRFGEVYEITVNSLDELIELGNAIGSELILDASHTPPRLGVYDNWIE